MDPWVAFQGIKVSIIGQVAQHHHGNVDLAALGLHRLLSQCHAIFFLDVDVSKVGYHTQHGHAAQVLKHLAPLIK